MVFTGLHGLTGLLGAKFLFKSNGNMKWSFVIGSVFPDIDIFGSIIIFLITQNRELTLGFHRTLTHSLITFSILAVIGGVLLLINDQNVFKTSGAFLIGFVLGGLGHDFLDLFYFDGIALFWPFDGLKGWNLIGIYYYNFPIVFQKLLITVDTFFEPYFWLTLIYLSKKYGTNETITFGKFQISNFRKKISIISIIVIILTPIYIIYALLTPQTSEALDPFVIMLYIPGMFVLALSMIIPWVMKDTLVRL